jgi:glycosyltransferase involved in cell wall biosynthesis
MNTGNRKTPPVEPVRVMRIIARLNVGGPAIHVSLLTVGLQDEVYQSTLVTGVVGPDEGDMTYLARDLGIQPVVIPTMQREISLLADLKTLAALVRLMRRMRPHIVHTHTAKAGFLGRLAARLTGVPVVVHTFHGHVFHGYFGPLKSGVFIRLERAAARLADAILTISDGLRDELIAYRIAPPERIRVVPLGLPLDPLRDLAGLRGSFRRELGCSTDDQLVGIIGRLVPVKNHELFLAAAQIVAREMPAARFVIVGGGERREALEAEVARLGLGDAVLFTGWRSDLPTIYADLDAVVIASRNEGTPVSLIEAMAAGVPVVSTAVGGVPDLLRGGELGTLVPPGDARALADAIITALRAPSAEQIEAARAWAFDQYGAGRLVADMRRLYGDLLAAKHLPAGDPPAGVSENDTHE